VGDTWTLSVFSCFIFVEQRRFQRIIERNKEASYVIFTVLREARMRSLNTFGRRYLSSTTTTQDVVIVGDGPVGMVLELLLTKTFGLTRVFRSRSSSSTTRSRHPRAHVLNTRTMEVFRSLSISREIKELSEPYMDRWRRFRYCTGMIGRTMSSVDHMDDEKAFDLSKHSPESVQHVSQPLLENILRKHLLPTKISPDDLVFEDFTQDEEDDTMIRVRFRDGTTVRTKYLIGADGAHSHVRQSAGLKMNGKNKLERFTSVHFRAPELWRRMDSKDAAMLSFVMNSKTLACVVAHNFEQGEYVAQLPLYDHVNQYEQSELEELISSCIGDSTVPFEIGSALEWSMSALVANSFSASKNRVFLVGDAAHVLPPSGGFGLNTGIQDAHNLAFKIANAVLNKDDDYDDDLLKSYNKERRPIAIRNARVGVENYERGLLVPKAIGLSRDILTSASTVLPSWLISTGVSMGLKALSVLEMPSSSSSSNPVASVMSNQIDRVARVNRDAIPMLFPDLDIGIRYDDDDDCHSGKQSKTKRKTEFEGDALYDVTVWNGSRLPHGWIMRHGDVCSTLDLVCANNGVCIVNGDKNLGGVVEHHDHQEVVVMSKDDHSDDKVVDLNQWADSLMEGNWKVIQVRPDGHICNIVC
jgi:2-polyprenyl-6-methoxyphenol hydroxylase-like FAD-dependent oxidoreductase